MDSKIETLIPPANRVLLNLTDTKAELDVSGSGDDTFIQRLIDEASEEIERTLGRPLFRGQYKETRSGSGQAKLPLRMRPIASLDAVSLGGTAQTLTDFDVRSPDLGMLYYKAGALGSPWYPGLVGVFLYPGDPTAWEVTTTSGYWSESDSLTGHSISVSDVDDSYNSASSGFSALLKAGERITVTGLSDAANNGVKVVTSATAAKIIVEQTLVTEGATSANLSLPPIPSALKRAAMTYVRSFYHSRDRTSGVVSERVDGVGTIQWSQTSPDLTDFHQALHPFMDLI